MSSLRRHIVLHVALLLFISLGAHANPVIPAFSASDFVPNAPIDNPYFPLVPGTTFHYAANVTDPDSGDKGFEREEDFVTFKSIVINNVHARVVHARTWFDDLLIEDTRDYFAQDKFGNVWYFGEDTKAFEYDDNGNLIDTDTSG